MLQTLREAIHQRKRLRDSRATRDSLRNAKRLAESHEMSKSPHNLTSSAWCNTCMRIGVWPSNFEELFPR